MKRKTITLIAVLLLAASILAVPAAAVSSPSDSGIAPQNEDLRTLYVTISQESGKVTCYSYAKTATSSYTVYLTMTLQKSSNGSSWSAFTDPWATSGTGSATLSRTRYVTPGYYYRTKAVASVYTASGTYVEQVTDYSGSVYYSKN